MLLNLLRLYKKYPNKNRTPLEDFNTECFAGILEMYPDIKEEFINFLKLPSDDYYVETQLKKNLENDPNCIIDFVLKGRDNICFIENKVESKEGWEQLPRYAKILDKYFADKRKFLFYCTKYSEPKNKKGEYNLYNFKQFKWCDIGRFLKSHKMDKPLISNYLNFLNHHNMIQDNIIKSRHLLAMENLLSTIELLEFHINNSKENFEKLFKSKKYSYKTHMYDQMKEHFRVSHYGGNILISPSGKYSELLYSINLESLKLHAHIWTSYDHEQYKLFSDLNYDKTVFTFDSNSHGALYYISEDLGKFLNDEESDEKIKKWFSECFQSLANLIKINSELDWAKMKFLKSE